MKKLFTPFEKGSLKLKIIWQDASATLLPLGVDSSLILILLAVSKERPPQ
jgi:hypothetical protein